MTTGDKRSGCRSVDKACPHCETFTLMLWLTQGSLPLEAESLLPGTEVFLKCRHCGYEEAILGEKTA